jgi:hypothetical protein
LRRGNLGAFLFVDLATHAIETGNSESLPLAESLKFEPYSALNIAKMLVFSMAGGDLRIKNKKFNVAMSGVMAFFIKA